MGHRRERESSFLGVPYMEHVHTCCGPAKELIFALGDKIGMYASDDYDGTFVAIRFCPWCAEPLVLVL